MFNKYTWIVLKKELTDIFRDKKTIITSILIPILVFPILAFVIGSSTDQFLGQNNNPVDMALISEEENKLEEFLKANDNVNIIEVENPQEALKELDIKVILKIDKGFDERIERGEAGNIEFIYDITSSRSDMAQSRLNGIIGEFSHSITLSKLEELGISSQILNPINIEKTILENQQADQGIGLMILSIILPLMLTVWSAVGGMAAATDLGVGEKERQTLEPLLTTKASRLSLLMGKYFAVVVAGILGTLAALTGFGIASEINPNFTGSGVTMPIQSIIAIGILCIGLALIFSALELTISFYARSFKEAQTYLSPMTIIVMIPAYFTMYLDGKEIPDLFLHIPIINTISIIKESIVGVFNIEHILIVAGWTIVYIGLALFFTVRMFNKESVIFRS